MVRTTHQNDVRAKSGLVAWTTIAPSSATRRARS
jgi:hypothetical protein